MNKFESLKLVRSLLLGVALIGGTATLTAEAANMPKQIVIVSPRVGGAGNVMANGVASILTKYSGTKATVRPVGSAGKWMGMFRNGEIDFGITSITELSWAYWGQKAYKGRPNPVFRVAALGTQQTWSFYVPKDAPVTSTRDFIAWMKGKKITHKWINPVIDTYNLAGLANLGISSLDEAGLTAVPVTSYRNLAGIWIERRADIVGSTVGVPVTQRMNVARPIRFISLNDSPEALARMQKVEPAVYLSKQPAGPTGIDKEITALTYDYTLVARNALDAAVVSKVLETLHAHQDELFRAHPLLKNWGRAEKSWAGTRSSIPFHAGAVAYYKAKGLWNADMANRQAEMEKATPR